MNRSTWRSTNEQAEDRLIVRAASDTENAWSIYSPVKILENLRAEKTRVVELHTEIGTLEDEWNRRGRWTRFFLVTAGHIHRTRSCSTCRITTDFRWLPNLSGQSDADAVAEHGPLLCTVCFPDAPVEWTAGVNRTHCDGGIPVEGTITTWTRGRYGECPTCHDRHPVTMSGQLRKHPVKK